MSQSTGRAELIRGLNLPSATSVVAGSVIGSGIFLVASDISKALPTPGLALAVWIVAGIISLLGGLTFAELGAAFPGAGGQYVYLREAFGPIWGFLFGWTWSLIVQPGSIAAVALAVTRFAGEITPMAPFTAKVSASFVIIAFTGINLFGVRKGAYVLDLLTSLKIIALVAIAAAGLLLPTASFHDATLTQSPGFMTQPWTYSSFGVALIAAFWAFDGWNNVTFVAGETQNPRRNIPLALIIGIAGVALLYTLVNSAYYRAMPVGKIAASGFPAGDFAALIGGAGLTRVMVIAVVLSALGCVNGMVLAGARVSYAMAADGALPPFLAALNERSHTPNNALLTQMGISVLLVWSGTYDQLFTYVVCAAFIFYGLTALSVLVLRRTRPEIERPYRVPLYPYLPLAYALFTAAFIINTFAEKPWESLIGLGIVAAGVPVFFIFNARTATRVVALEK